MREQVRVLDVDSEVWHERKQCCSDWERSHTSSDVYDEQRSPMARFRMVVQERRFDRGLDRFVDGDASYFTVIAWRHIATNVIESVNQGDPIVVSGRLRVRD